ncbi:lrr receptor-like serine/threonine-protein kinase efr [Quercus suber]|uniref:Lrr receptor-like serine/threonine-protein kinase efr n=1 Tax=Quercus suber TaxID=58331 RepID=A0AAW0K8P4_QUESU
MEEVRKTIDFEGKFCVESEGKAGGLWALWRSGQKVDIFTHKSNLIERDGIFSEKILLEDLELLTELFSEENFIGNVKFRKVYRGKLSKGKSLLSKFGFSLIYKGQTECTFLTHPDGMNHPNLVKLIRYCCEVEDHHLGVVYDLKSKDSLLNLIDKDVWWLRLEQFSFAIVLIGLICKRSFGEENWKDEAVQPLLWATEQYHMKLKSGFQPNDCQLIHEILKAEPGFHDLDGVEMTKMIYHRMDYLITKRPMMSQIVQWLHGLHVFNGDFVIVEGFLREWDSKYSQVKKKKSSDHLSGYEG